MITFSSVRLGSLTYLLLSQGYDSLKGIVHLGRTHDVYMTSVLTQRA